MLEMVTAQSTRFTEGYSFYVRKDFKSAINIFRKEADAGDGNAMYMLSEMNRKGEGFDKDSTESFNWLKKASGTGHPAAMFKLGVMYLHGTNVTRDSSAGLQLIQRSAEKNYSNALYELGYLYDNGKDVTKDSVLALKWYTKAVEAGNVMAMNNLGFKYSIGRWVKKDYALAVRLFQKAADAGLPSAMFNLGRMYEFGRGVEQNDAEALKWYRKALEKSPENEGGPNYSIGLFYESGRGGLTQDYAEATKYFMKSKSPGMQHIGRMYELGKGVPADISVATVWYKSAANNDNGFGMYYLGHVQKDPLLANEWYKKAITWFQKHIASTFNDTESMRGLASMYENGYGTEKNMDEAIKLYQLAADWGDVEAKAKLKGIRNNY